MISLKLFSMMLRKRYFLNWTGKYFIDSDKCFEFDDGYRRGHSKKLFKRSRLNLRKFVFGNRVIDHWNGLSDSCVNCSTINSFQSKIKLELEPEL